MTPILQTKREPTQSKIQMHCNLLSLISDKKFAEHLYHGLPFGLAFWVTEKKENTKQTNSPTLSFQRIHWFQHWSESSAREIEVWVK